MSTFTMSESAKESIRKAASEKKSACEAVRNVIAAGSLTDLALPEGFLEALKIAVGFRAKGASAGTAKRAGGILEQIADYFSALEVGQGRDEMDVFAKFRMGRAEMTSMRRRLIVDMEPASRVYIQFNDAAEAWVFMGEGSEVPENFQMPSFSDKVRERAGL